MIVIASSLAQLLAHGDDMPEAMRVLGKCGLRTVRPRTARFTQRHVEPSAEAASQAARVTRIGRHLSKVSVRTDRATEVQPAR
jgi:hypothetical protein